MVNPAPETAGRRPGEKASSFSLTCSLLSQYLKEKGGLGDLGLGISSSAAVVEGRGRPEPLRTMNLLPGVESAEGPASNRDAAFDDGMNMPHLLMDLFPRRAGFVASEEKKPDPVIREPQKAQMTIFYGGKVVVLDNVPAGKARELMVMAGRACPAPAPAPAPCFRAEQPALQRPGCHPSAQRTSAAAPHSAPEAKSATEPTPAAVVISQEAPPKPPQPPASDMPIARRVSLHRFLEKRKDRISAKAPYPAQAISPMGTSASPLPPLAKAEETLAVAVPGASGLWAGGPPRVVTGEGGAI